MSGIVGIVNHRVPVDRNLLERLTASLSFRGPDAQSVWLERHVGLGHALLQAVEEVPRDTQPLSLDGTVWITADARVDDRARLIEDLELGSAGSMHDWTDAELILRSYMAWGDECASHLLGDFAFAIWDGRRKRLLCVRDQLGIKPFFYAVIESGLVFSNTLGCVRLHPEVPRELNDLAIADFLLFGHNAEPDTTAFAAIHRLPPGHRLVYTPEGPRVSRYWKMPVRQPLNYRRPADYVEQFTGLLHQAVADRVRTERVAISLSGGLDSSAIAVTVQELAALKGRPSGLRAWTSAHDATLPDEERYYASLVADALRVPITFQMAESYRLSGVTEHRSFRPPEPRTLFGTTRQIERLTQVVAHSRVVLTGQGGDVILRPSASSLIGTIGRRGLGSFATDAWKHVRQYRRLPRLGIRTALRRWTATRQALPPLPEWLDATLVDRLHLRDRVRDVLDRPPEAVEHHRPEAYEFLTGPQWPRLFENYDPEVTGFPVEYRHPLFDLRVVDFALAIPTIPWCIEKALTRESMRGKLPEAVRRRRKTPLAGNPFPALLEEFERLETPMPHTPIFQQYVRPDQLLRAREMQNIDGQRMRARALYLNLWLTSLQ